MFYAPLTPDKMKYKHAAGEANFFELISYSLSNISIQSLTMTSLVKATQLLSISTALLASGGILTLSLFDTPLLKSQPASRSLPQIRWLFSRGSHIFPTAAIASSAGFLYLAYTALPTPSLPLLELLKYGRVPGFLLAAILSCSIGPFTQLMIPTNFGLIELNERKGGTRSERSKEKGAGGRKSAEESVQGKGDVNQFTDLSGPVEKTEGEASEKDEQEVQELLEKFGRLNAVRAVLLGAGGMVGLWTVLV